MNRRNFVHVGVLGAAGGLLAPASVRATVIDTSKMAGGIYYTREFPGRWDKKINSHVPKVDVSAKGGGEFEVVVTTFHSFTGYRHYIVKHMLLDSEFNFIEEYMFDPEKEDEAKSRYTLRNLKGQLHALSVCNRHDAWLTTVEV
jgi:superoxide reductase